MINKKLLSFRLNRNSTSVHTTILLTGNKKIFFIMNSRKYLQNQCVELFCKLINANANVMY